MEKNRVDCGSELEGLEVVAHCEAEGFVAELSRKDNGRWEVQYWKQEIAE